MEAAELDGITYLIDAYNASPDSTSAALQALAEVPASGKRVAVLGEMKELGDYTERGHRLVGQSLAAAMPDACLLTGGPTSFIAEEAMKSGYPESRLTQLEAVDLDVVRSFLGKLTSGDVALIKGSRALGLETALPEGVKRV
jgi:UDP-N-acetylmuramoyl-tripeptide--D-alanyl-D-alanine ligase